MIGFAHRGGMAHWQANTLAAFVNAKAMGATAVETDAWLTKDGVVVLDHDGVVRRGWHHVAIANLTRAELPPHIPTLAEYYALLGTELDVSNDVKDAEAAQAVIAAAANAGGTALSRLWLADSAIERLEKLRPLSAAVHLVYSPTAPDWHRLRAAVPRLMDRLNSAGVEVLNLKESDANPGVVAAVHHAGGKVFGWNVHTQRSAQRLVAMGVDGIYSNDVNILKGALSAPANQLSPV